MMTCARSSCWWSSSDSELHVSRLLLSLHWWPGEQPMTKQSLRLETALGPQTQTGPNGHNRYSSDLITDLVQRCIFTKSWVCLCNAFHISADVMVQHSFLKTDLFFIKSSQINWQRGKCRVYRGIIKGRKTSWFMGLCGNVCRVFK